MAVLFWLCAFGALYSYFVYPLLLLVLPGRSIPRTAEVKVTSAVRRVSIICAARNESAKIEAKLANCLALTHPGVEIEILIASDASDDGMDAQVQSYASRGVRLIRSPERRGKEYAQKLAIEASTGDPLIFTDVGTALAPDVLDQLLRRFADPTVGAVSSVDAFTSDDGVVHGEGLYVRYEMWLRDLEECFHSLVGLSGSFFAARRAICSDWDTQVPSDFGTALRCVEQGYRAVSDRGVVGYYKNIADPSKEYRRKLRTVLRGMLGLRRRREVLNGLRYGRFSFEVFSHKLMRWAVPWFLLGALLTSIPLAIGSRLYGLLLVLQIGLYLVPLLARVVPGVLKIAPLRLASFFIEVNLAIAHATLLVLRGRTALTWEPSKR